MLWVMEGDAFYLDSLQKQTDYRPLLRLIGNDPIVLDELAEDLTDVSKEFKVTRSSLLFSLGAVAVKRRKGIEQVLKDRIGNKFDWKVVSAGVDFEHENAFQRFLGCLLAPLPVVWIRIAL